MVVCLDAALEKFAQVVERDLKKQVNDIPGAGAAGGMGAAFCAFLNAELRPGIDIMTQAVGLEALVQDADLVITGEGRLDSQSVNGKVPVGVAKVAKRYNLPVIAIAGALADDVEEVYSHGIDAAFDTVYKITTFDEIVAQAKANVIRSSFNIAAALKLGQQLKH